MTNMGKGNMGSMKNHMLHNMMMGKKKKKSMGMDMMMGSNTKIDNKNPAKYIRSLGHNIVTSLVTQTTTTLTVSTAQHSESISDFMTVVAFLYYGSAGAVTCADSLGHTYSSDASNF